MAPATHPSDKVLALYGQGRLPLAEAAALDTHLSDCSDCVGKLAGVGSDTFSDLLRQTVKDDTAVQAAAFPELPPELRNHPRYEIMAKLGQGGMGVVYRARHRMMSRAVALKLIRTDLLSTPLAVARFRREVQTAAKLAHPNIVTAHDAEEIGGVHFLVMEYVEGRTLDRIVSKRGPLPVNLACALARQVALGLDHAHAHGMVHRDIKPQNLIATEKSRMKILDFGLALWRDGASAAITSPNATLGTLLYAAPEQHRTAGEVDHRADLYALGATLYYLLTGCAPLKKVEDTGSYEMPATVPGAVMAIVEKLMAHDPADRYGSAKEAAEALAPWCATIKPEAKRTKRKRWPVFAALAAVAVGVTVAFSGRGRATSASPVASAAQVEPVWKSLMSEIDVNRDAVAGEWKRIRDDLACRPARGGRLMLPTAPAGDYDLRIGFTRKYGKHSVGAVVVQNGRQVAFELDAWEQHLAGFQEIGGASIVDNVTRRDSYELVNGQRYVLTLEVRKDELRARLDGQEVTRYRTTGDDLALNPQFWSLPKRNALGLLAWDCEVVFHTVEIRTQN